MYRDLSNAETVEFYNSTGRSYFPVLIQYTTGEKFVANTPEDIENGKAFTVLKTNYSHQNIY